MGSERTDAINNMINNQGRRTSFYYVNFSTLDRLGISQFKTVSGDNFIRIMPPPNPKDPWAYQITIHQHIGSDNATFLCLKEMFGQPCPVCELIESMKKDGASKDSIKPIDKYTRYLMFVFDVRNSDTENEGLRWYDAPSKVVNGIAGLSRDKRTRAIIDVCDPVDGRDVEFVRKGTPPKVDYDSFNLKVADPVPADWYKNVPPFADVLLVPTYDQIMYELSGGISANQDNEEADQTTPTRRSRGQEQNQPTTQEQTSPKTNESGQQPTSRRSSRGESQTHNQPAPSQSSTPPSVNQDDIRKKLEEIRQRRQNQG